MSVEETYRCPGCGGRFRVRLDYSFGGDQDWHEGTTTHQFRIVRYVSHEGARERRSGSDNPACIESRERMMREVAERDSAALRSVHSMLASGPRVAFDYGAPPPVPTAAPVADQPPADYDG